MLQWSKLQPLRGSRHQYPSGEANVASASREQRAASPMFRHKVHGTNRTKKNTQGDFSDTTQPSDPQRRRGQPSTVPDTGPFPCPAPGCDRTFTTKTGRGVHQQRSHKDWYDADQLVKKPLKKRRWTEEEQSIMAREEARQTTTTGKVDVRKLAALIERTIDGVKGQRKNAQYKDLVLKFLSTSLPPPDRPPSPPPPPEPTPPTQDDPPTSAQTRSKRDDSLRQAIIDQIESLLTQSDTINPLLLDISSSGLNSKGAVIRSRLAALLPKLFPNAKKGTRKFQTHKPGSEDPLSRKEKHRRLYRSTQKDWSRNPGRTIKKIVGDTVEATTMPPKSVMLPFWSTVMTSTTHSTPGHTPPSKTHPSLWAPITTTEASASYPNLGSVPGPDAITTKDAKALSSVELALILNLLMLCDHPPHSMLESRTTLIPKKVDAPLPSDYRPISVSSVLLRCLHRVLAKRITSTVKISPKQTAFRPLDGCSLNVHLIDLALRYHREKHKSLYMASIDVSKAYDTVTHETIRDTLHHYGIPAPMLAYIMGVYDKSTTRLAAADWESEPLHPATGVKQGDPLSPALFNLVMDRFITQLPDYIGARIGDYKINAAAFADDVVLFAGSKSGLQHLLDIATTSLEVMGLRINTSKCHTMALTNIPKEKKTAIDASLHFRSGSHTLPAVARSDEWKYLGVQFTSEGRGTSPALQLLRDKCAKISQAPLKPQQRLFALRNYILPSIVHGLTLGVARMSYLRQIDTTTRQYVRKWLHLPADTPTAYFHAEYADGGLHVPALRWTIPELRRRRLRSLASLSPVLASLVLNEIDKCTLRLNDHGQTLSTKADIKSRWATLLHKSVDGAPLSHSALVPQQHRWIMDGTTFLSGADFVNLSKLRVNALPSRSRCSRGRPAKDRFCRGGCNAVETTNHILQGCHRTQDQRIKRHNSVAKHVVKIAASKGLKVYEEPHIQGPNGLNKPDLIVCTEDTAHVLDVQVINDQYCLARAHRNKMSKYMFLADQVKTLTTKPNVKFSSVTLNWRGIWSIDSLKQLQDWDLITIGDIKIISTRVLVGGVAAFRIFQSTTAVRGPNRTGIG